MKLNKNVGNLERVMRITVGIILTTFTVIGPKHPLFLLGLVPIFTGISGWCLPYQILGISTCKLSKKN